MTVKLKIYNLFHCEANLHLHSTGSCTSLLLCLLRVSANVGSDLGGDVQAVCTFEAVARTDTPGTHSLSGERLCALLHLEGLAGTQQH